MTSTRRFLLLRSFVVTTVLLVVFGCLHKPVPRPRPTFGAVAVTVSCSTNGAVPSLNCAALPNTNAAGQWVDTSGNVISTTSGQTTTNAYLDYDLWAWNSFIAMNWPAIIPSASNNYARGMPDTTKSFAGAKSGDTAVWETYKEKREVFLYDYVNNVTSTQVPQPWNSLPQYGPSNVQVPCCPNTNCNVSSAREIGLPSKLIFDTLDETAEVASEALEQQAALCAGWVTTAQCAANPAINPCCKLNGSPVGPRVWRGNPYPAATSTATPVLYEVKVNYDSFNYIVDTANQYYNVNNARTAATAGNIRLPARTSAAAMPPPANSGGAGNGPNAGVLNYDATRCLSVTGNPCPAGAVHLKAAWLQLGPNDNPSKYHTATAYQYITNTSVTGGICKSPGLFGLIGLHIIQRIHENVPAQAPPGGQASSSGQPRGGTYVFASWEHVDNDSAGFTYVNYAPTSGSSPAPYPNIAAAPALALNRVYPILPSTARATAQIHSLLGCTGGATDSVWCNYELIGTQYVATQTPNPQPTQLSALTPQPANIEAPPNSGQPYYLANLVVESNVGLQQFQGLPPSSDTAVITVINHYSANNFSSQFNTTSFQRTADNVAFRTKKDTNHQYVMGGCMGCHGVAQLSGYSFSFVLLDNQYGAIPDTQTAFSIPPTAGPPSN